MGECALPLRYISSPSCALTVSCIYNHKDSSRQRRVYYKLSSALRAGGEFPDFPCLLWLKHLETTEGMDKEPFISNQRKSNIHSFQTSEIEPNRVTKQANTGCWVLTSPLSGASACHLQLQTFIPEKLKNFLEGGEGYQKISKTKRQGKVLNTKIVI